MKKGLKLYNIYLEKEEEVLFRIGNYDSNGNTYVQMIGADGEPYGDLTVNFETLNDERKAYIDTNNNPGILKFIEDNELGFWFGLEKQSNFCTYPLYYLDLEEIKKYVVE
ncbi:MAG: DUF4313 domain-containing protein [Lachnospiraceae bacterium]|nr:DUF4313 domain-containing protein [Lachnospiraceae bacterium]